MLILPDRKLIEAKFASEEELETVVLENYEHFFGSSSILVPKARINAHDGSGTIPDGFAVDLASRRWFIVEAELKHHSLWRHIAPQVTKQILAASRPETRSLITELLVQMVSEDDELKERFSDEGIAEIDIRKVLAEILETEPIVGIPIDGVTKDLTEWAETLKHDVKLWIVRKYVQFDDRDYVGYEFPEEHSPVFDTSQPTEAETSGRRSYDVALVDLVDAGYLQVGDKLSLTYKPRGSKKKRVYKGIIEPNGSITVDGETFSSPSYAALYCIQDSGSHRSTINGWKAWRTPSGAFLHDVRNQLLASPPSADESP